MTLRKNIVRYTLGQTARMLQLNTKTVTKLIKQGKLRGFKLDPSVQNSKWLIPSDAVEEYLAYQSALTMMLEDEKPKAKTLLEVFTGETPETSE